MNGTTIVAALGIPVLRSVGGWLNNSLEDGRIDKFEWQKLGATIIRVGSLAIVAYFGFNSAGIDIDAVSASAGAFIVDLILGAIKKPTEVKKKK